MELSLPADRYPEPVEATAYYVVAEALTNIAQVRAGVESDGLHHPGDDRLLVDVEDDGVGGVDSSGRHGPGRSRRPPRSGRRRLHGRQRARRRHSRARRDSARLSARPAGCELRAPRRARRAPARARSGRARPGRSRARSAARPRRARGRGHQVEELLAVDLPERRTVRAAHVVREDLEARDRVGVRLSARGAGCGSPGRRSSSARPARRGSSRARPRVASSRSAPLKAKSRRRVRRDVLLERVVVQVLVAVGEVGAGHARGRALAGEVVLDPDLALLRAEAAATQSSSASRSTRAWCVRSATSRARGSGARRTRAWRRASTKSSTAAFEYAGELGRRSRRTPRSARTRLPGLGDDEQAPEERAALDGVDDADHRAAARARRPSGRARAGRASSSAALCAANFSSEPDELAEAGAIRRAARSGCPRARGRSAMPALDTRTMPAASSSSSPGARRAPVAPFAENVRDRSPADR